jgi:hypothetical protein
MAAAVAFLVLLVLAGPAYAGERDVTGRAFVLARLPGHAYATQVTPVAMAADGTVWTIGANGSLWRFGAGDSRPVRVFTGHAWSDLAASSDGGLVLASETAGDVWRRAPDGGLSLVAGRLSRYPDPGVSMVDGGQATRTLICSVGAVTTLPDGGFAFADRYGRAVRRVAPDGTISTLYAVTAADRAYGCPATGESYTGGYVADVAAERDGALLLLLTVAPPPGLHGWIVRLAPTGAQSPIRGLHNVGSIAAAADGSMLLTDRLGPPFAVRRLAPGARRAERILPGIYVGEIRGRKDPFAYDGAPAAEVRGVFFGRVAGAPDGGIIATGDDENGTGLIVYVAPAAPARLAVALEPRSGRATSGGYAVRYRVTRPGRARLAVVDHAGGVVASVDARASLGVNTIALQHRFKFATYTVQLRVTSSDQVARQAIRVFLGGALPVPVGFARKLMVPDEVDIGGGCSNCEAEYVPVRYEGCRRIDDRRVDCRHSYRWGDRADEQTCTISSAQLHLVGALLLREYSCPKTPGIPSRPPLGSVRQVLPEQTNPGAPAPYG